MWAMLWFNAQVGPDSQLGWVLLILVAYAPILVIAGLLIALVVSIARATVFREPPSETPAQAAGAPPDPEGTAAYLSDRARDRRASSQESDQTG